MKNMKNDWMKLLITLTVAAAAFLIFTFLPMKFHVGNLSLAVRELIAMMIEFVIFFAAALVLKKTSVLKFRKEGFGQGLLAAAVLLVMSVSIIFTMVSNVMNYGAVMTIPVSEFLIMLLNYLMIGICEELLFRGIVQNSLHEFFGEDSQAKVRLVILIQAVLFGSVHFVNIITAGTGFASSLMQVISGIGMGAILGAVYYRSKKNLWVVIAVHAIVDFRAFVSTGVLTGTSTAESVGSYAQGESSIMILIAGAAMMALIYIGIALFVTRKKKIMPLLAENM